MIKLSISTDEMARTIISILALTVIIMANAKTFSYRFKSTPLPIAIQRIMENNPELDINFIYDELENYTTSATVNADNAYSALRQTIGLNPVTVIKSKNTYYVEARQHGKYTYTGKAIGTDNEPVVAATVMLLAPKDSTVVTYGITDEYGRFSIPCDLQKVVAKFSCLGHTTIYHRCNTFNIGTIILPEHAVALGEIKVAGDNARLYADRSTYIPTQRQKNASQSGSDLLDHMAIPQLGLISDGNITTNAGKPVAVFINYLPASGSDLQAMRISDVKKVEFYENPSDPRLQGNQYVVNYIVQEYEYGGYLKTFGHANFISNPMGELLANLRLQRKRMTYDIMGSTYHYNRGHIGSELTETYRLPQDNGDVKEFTRYSTTSSSKDKHDWYFATLRATYNSDNIQASSQVKGRIDRQPTLKRDGCVIYTPQDYPNSSYSSLFSSNSQYLAYEGYYFFILPRRNSLTFTPSYSYSHTQENTEYEETGYSRILNGAKDNTSKVAATLKYSHDFGRGGNLLLNAKGSYEYNRTRYSGSATALDRAKSSRIELEAAYNITVGNFYGATSFGWDWDRLQFNDFIDKPSTPKANISLRYAPNRHNSFSLSASYESWLPSPSFKSDKIIEASYLMRYTGNPNLIPAKSYDFDFTYTWVPDNNFNLSAFAWAWFVGDRYVYDYEATSTGILRTIKQPMGSFIQGTYGINGSARFLDRSLVLSGRIGHLFNHNGMPYNVNHSHINWYARARYYIGNWNFTLTYSSDNGSADGCMNGLWAYGKSDWYITVGWSDSHWNIRGDLFNFTRWNWRNSHLIMHSKYYDTDEIRLNGNNRAFIQLSATYTFGFGKKIKNDDEPSVTGSASSGILK